MTFNNHDTPVLILNHFKSLVMLIETGKKQAVGTYLDERKYTTDRCTELAKQFPDVSYWMFLAVQKAAKLGHVSVLDFLISRGFNYEAGDYQEQPPLHAACKMGHLEVVKSLVENHGVGPDQKNSSEETPLLVALESREIKPEIVQCLLKAGASLNNRREDANFAPLVHAAASCSFEICQLLLSYGAGVNACNMLQETPLSAAISSGRLDNVRGLLDAGADIGSFSKCRDRPIEIALMCENLAMIKLLYSKGARLDHTGWRNDTLLHRAARVGNYEIVKYLAFEIGVEVDVTNYDDQTPFMAAIGEGNIDIADMLVKSGYTPREDELMFESNDLILQVRGIAERIEDWKQIISSPRRLQELCIFRIRQIISPHTHLSTGTESLPLPSQLRAEIRMVQ